jgi:hypothetical protein
MQGGKSKSEKVEVIKSLIRRYHYKEYEKVYDQCLDIGISVNLSSLARFSEKLELLDRAVRSRRVDQIHNDNHQPAKLMSYEQVKRRETEITFELGELKIQENKLLEELNKLSAMLDSNQIN